jgi:hypothetical protein
VINNITKKINIASVRKKEKIRWNDKCKDKKNTRTHLYSCNRGRNKEAAVHRLALGGGGRESLEKSKGGKESIHPQTTGNVMLRCFANTPLFRLSAFFPDNFFFTSTMIVSFPWT